MINVKVTYKSKQEDYIAVERETGAFVLPGRHVFGIFCTGIISVLLALPFGQLIPENYSPFSALTAKSNQKNSQYEKEYLKNNEKIVEQNIEIASTAGSQENYDDEIIIPNDLLANGSSYDGLPDIVKETDNSSNREKFVSADIQNTLDDQLYSDSNVGSINIPENHATGTKTENHEVTAAEKFISGLISPNAAPTMITQNSDALLEKNRDEIKINAQWYEQTIRRNDSLSKIFSYLNLDKDALKKIIARADPGDLNLIVNEKIQFLVDDNNVILEIAIPISQTKQARFTLDPIRNTYVMAHEQRNAQFADTDQKLLNASMLPSFIEIEKERQRKDEEKALLAKREAEIKAKEAKERKELARLEAQKREKEKQDLLLSKKQSTSSPEIASATRPRLVIGTISSRENFDRAARRMGLSNAEIASIKSQFTGKLNIAKLRPGDNFRVLFNGIGTGSSMTAIEIKSSQGHVTLYRHPQNHIFYEENGYKPTVGEFRRFPVMGQIKVNSPFNLNRYHPIKKKIRPHYGVDFKLSIGTPIYAPADGVVTYASFMRGGGYTVILNHKDGYSTVYMHLSKFDVRKGDTVHLGQIIAKSGNTGYSTGPHLHYEVHVNGRAVDPLKVDLPSGNPATAKKLSETFKNTVHILKSELNKESLAIVK